MNQTLDDIIKTRRLVSGGGGARGKFNTFRSSGPGLISNSKKGIQLRTMGAKTAPLASRLGDARMKIIAKKRQNLVDARDQLNEIARQSDAREKLIMIRAKKITGNPKSLFTKALGNLKSGGITKQQRKPGGFVSKRQKFVPLKSLTRTVQLSPEPPRNYLQIGRLGRAQPMHDIDIEVYNDLDAVDRMSPPRGRERLPDYDELLAMYTKNKIRRNVPQTSVSKRSSMAMSQQPARKSSSLRMDQYYNEESEEEEEEDEDGMDIDDLPASTTKFMGRTIQTKQQPTNMFRRVQNPTTSRPSTSYKKPVTEGYRVRISNLAQSVTKDDIMELFSDPGPLHKWDLLLGGIAEVYYKKRSDAITAVDSYHKRLLDGQPMTVTFYDH